MKILIAGASGFVGQELGIHLVRKGWTVSALVRSPAKSALELPYPCELHAWPRGKEVDAGLLSALDGVDAVVNLSGEPIQTHAWTEARIKALTDSRVETTRLLGEACTKLGAKAPKILVNASAIGFYGNRLQGEELTETSAVGSGLLPEICQAWEGAIKAFPESMRRVALRIGVVLGRHGGMLPQILPLFRRGVAGRLGNGQQWMSWIHVEDLVRLIIHCIETPQLEGPVNATAPTPVTNASFTKVLAATLKVSAPFPAPAPALRLALGKRSALLLDSAQVLPKRALAAGFSFDHPELGKALAHICTAPKDGPFNELNVRQWVASPLNDVAPFFQNEYNLERLTPDLLHFKVLRKSTDKIEEGTLIDYRLKIRGVPARWRTRIENWNPPHSFVDTQLKGPYNLWHHTHTFEPLGSGTLLTDRVLFRLPMGIAGEAVAGWMVRSDVQKIFAWRRKVAAEIFGGNRK